MSNLLDPFLQQFCMCGAGIAAQHWEKNTFDAWVEHHPRTCGEGFSDEKPFRVSHQCADCGIYVYGKNSTDAVAILRDHPCPAREEVNT